MNTILHYATCPIWQTSTWADCTCFLAAPWRISKEPGERFPWRIWRRVGDSTYEPLMRASTWQGAINLVDQMIWLRNNALVREPRG